MVPAPLAAHAVNATVVTRFDGEAVPHVEQRLLVVAARVALAVGGLTAAISGTKVDQIAIGAVGAAIGAELHGLGETAQQIGGTNYPPAVLPHDSGTHIKFHQRIGVAGILLLGARARSIGKTPTKAQASPHRHAHSAI